MRRPAAKRLFVGALIAAAATLLVYLPAAGATGTTVVSNAQLDTDANNSQAIGETMQTFAGLYVSGSTIYVGVTQDTPAIEAQIENGANPSEYVFMLRSTSWNTLLRMQEKLVSGASSDSLSLSEVWPDPKTDTLGVGVTTAPTADTASTVASLAGSNAVTVSQIPIGNGQPLTATRSNDNSPWNGGDYLAGTYTGPTCSAGPPVTGNQTGDDYILTAGHCWIIGDTIKNYDTISGVGGFDAVGTVNFGVYTDNADGDVHGILTTGYGGSSSLDFFGTGGPNDSTSTDLTAGQDPSVGTAVCGDGAFEGRRCGGDVQKILVCKHYQGENPNIMHCGEDEEISAGTYIAGNGDSGGPVTGPSGHTAFGTIAYGEGTTTPCPTENPDGSRTCYGTVWFESMGYIQRFYGVTVK